MAPIYLSRLILDSGSRQVRSELAHPYEMHRTLMHAFKDHLSPGMEMPREKCGMLFRAEIEDSRGGVRVYVQSTVEPNWSFLFDLNCYLQLEADPPNPAWKDVSEAYRNLRLGQVCSFRLRANPTKRINDPENMKGKRVGLLRQDEQIEWLTRKGREREPNRPGGFEILMQQSEDRNGKTPLIPRVRIECEGKLKGRKFGAEKLHQMKHLAVLFEGLLQIIDVDCFQETLIRGIGSGKAFGFGLLSIAPISPSHSKPI